LFIVHARWVLTHFSNDGYLYDSGWLAYLFESRDPLLHNPSAIGALSFYAYHLSPHIYLVGAPPASLGLHGFQIFAIHQGMSFALVFVGAWRLATAAPRESSAYWMVIAGAVLLGAFANALFQAAGYPHYEIAMLALSILALAAWVRDERWLFAVALVWLVLVREDGGFYAAYICLVCAALAYEPGTSGRAIRLVIAAVAGVCLAVMSLVIKAGLFPGFDTFAFNFSGHHWDHLTAALVVDRLGAAVVNPNVLPVLVGCAVLATRSVKYVAGFALLVPLYALYMMSVRPNHAYFTLYFALPWLLPPMTWVAVYVVRARSGSARTMEAIVILAVALGLAAPVHAALRLPRNSWYVAQLAIQRPVVDIRSMQQFTVGVLRLYRGDADPGRVCASMGIAALVPNDLRPHDVVDREVRISDCQMLLLLNGDMDYGPLRSKAERDGLRMAAWRWTAEVWMRQKQ